MAKQKITTGQGMDELNPVPIVSDENKELTVDIIKEMAQKGIIAKYPKTGKAINFLLFGGYGVPGLVGDAELVIVVLENKDKNVDTDFTQDMAVNLSSDIAKLALEKTLERFGITVLEKLENPLLFFSILFDSETLRDGTLPPELKPTPQIQSQGEKGAIVKSGDDPKLNSSGGGELGGSPVVVEHGGGGNYEGGSTPSVGGPHIGLSGEPGGPMLDDPSTSGIDVPVYGNGGGGGGGGSSNGPNKDKKIPEEEK